MILNRRDRDLIRLGGLGLSDKAIAITLNLSTNTVKMYFAKLRGKLGNFDRMMLPGIALVFGILSVADIVCGAETWVKQIDPEPPNWQEGAD